MNIISGSLRTLSNILAYNVERDPCYISLNKALEAVKSNKLPAAKGFLQQAKGSIDQKYTSAAYIKNPEYTRIIKDLKTSYEGAVQAIQKNDTVSAEKLLEQSLKSLKDAEKFIK